MDEGAGFPIPDGYRTQLTARDLVERTDFLAALPGMAQRFARRWSLRPDGAPVHGYCGVVWPVRRADDTPAMLKISWPHPEAQDEGAALAAWAGHGTVQLLEHDDDAYALLLERLDPNQSLHEEPIDEATHTLGRMLRTMTVPDVSLHRSVTADAAEYARTLPARNAERGDPVPVRMLDAAVDICRALGPKAGSLLVNEDLHYFNVLRGDREPWLLIDPKPLAGDPEWCVAQMLWNRYDETGGAQAIPARFDTIVRIAELDRELARAWTLVRAVVAWQWAYPDGTMPYVSTLAEIATAMID
jgi:streptomycin 6-kinase